MLSAAIIAASIIGVLIGVIAATSRGQFTDVISRIIAIAGTAMPAFWLSILLQLLFFKELGILPASGRFPVLVEPPQTVTGLYIVDSLLTGNINAFVETLRHLALPAFTLMLALMSSLMRQTRSAMIEVLGQDFDVCEGYLFVRTGLHLPD